MENQTNPPAAIGPYHLGLWVPRPGKADRIAPASGIVGLPYGEDQVELHYEGNIYGWNNLKTYADKLWRASYRMLTRYPTIAFGILPATEVQQVGVMEGHRLRVTDEAALAAWIETPILCLAEQMLVSQGDPIAAWDWWHKAPRWREEAPHWYQERR